ncbi:MAG TPA: wax ester/triacylglycerol synthase family O-acyltransferase [Anaeromyxobacteraceae bacterium]|nr:wax ester/triacylglycerol synthase family O-acyltransferase [Anaeromyxobacteraceae bacterium]
MAERMRSVDAAWLQMDRPTNAADVVALLTFDEPVPFPRLAAVVEDRLLAFERFRQRVERRALGGARWEPDWHFQLGHHLERARLPGGGQRALRDFVGNVATEPLRADRPLWRLLAVEGYGPGSALVAKLHHCIGDGLALISLLLSLTEPAGGEAGPLRFPALGLPDLSLRALRAALGDWRRVRELVRQGAGMAASLARMVTLPRAPDTPLRRPLSGLRRVAWSRGIPLPALQRAAHARGATLNDLLLAALAGGLRGHLAAAGTAVGGLRLRALVPVNLRAPAEGRLGNRFGLVFVELPVGLATAEERLAAVHRRMDDLKAGPDAAVTYAVLSALGRLPAAAEIAINRFFASKASMSVTNVPGPPAPLSLAGSRVGSIMFWVPHPSLLGLGVSILTYAGELRLGVRADAALVSDPGDLVERTERELEMG